MTCGRIFTPCLAALLLSACEQGKEDAGEAGFDLPTVLNEVSGLAVASPVSVFTHDDTHAIVYELNLDDGRTLRAFALGNPTIEGDFEGIATAGNQVFLITSDGLIYAALTGLNGERVPYKVYDSGIGKICETEGLANAPEPDMLLILCKRLRAEESEPKLEIFAWKIGADRAEEQPWLSVPYDQLIEEHDWTQFGPSGLEWDPVAGHLLVVSAHNRQLLILDRQGGLIKRLRFDQTRHPKVEGIALMPDRRMVLSDEGSRARNGRISYFPMPKT